MYDIQEIKNKINCLEYARQQGISVDRPGDRTSSPFHAGSNKTSFVCYENSWYSFSDDMGGDVIDLCAQLEFNGDKGKAITHLAHLTNTKADADSAKWIDYMQQLGNQVFYYHTKLTEEDRDYLHSRGILDETIDEIKIGRNEEGRLVIPYWKNGGIVYYATRALPGCKYPESKYRKMRIDNYNENCPWGLPSLNRESDYLIIAEGAFDALSAYQQGYPTLSAITGHFSSRQLSEVIDTCHRFKHTVLTYDDDSKTSDSGAKFTLKMAQILFQNRIDFLIAPMPYGIHDLSEYHQAGGLISELVKTAQPGISYLCSTFTDYDDLRQFVLKIARNTPADILANHLSHTHFDASVIRELIKTAKNCPNEQTIADEITSQHTLIYVPNDAFYEWNGKSWDRSDDLIIQDYAIQTYGKQFATALRAKSVATLLKALLRRDIVFNRTPVMSFQNGTLELDTGTFREHRQSDYVSLILSYNYDASAQCPNWRKFINEITADEPHREELLQQIAGYILYPTCKFQKIFVLIGEGSNGKSIYLNMLEQVYDRRNCTYVDPVNMQNEFWLIHLKDSLLNFATEIGTDFARSENILKMLSDGTTIQACYKGQNHITFEPRAKLVFACNAMPKTQTIRGMERRLQFIEFPVKFVDYPEPGNPYQKQRDYDLFDKLLTELPAIFNWCYDGYKNLHQYNEITDTPEQASYIQEFREASNPVEVFVNENISEFSGRMAKADIYSMYCQWCTVNGHCASNSHNFYNNFKIAMGDRIVKEGNMRFDGAVKMGFEFKIPEGFQEVSFQEYTYNGIKW